MSTLRRNAVSIAVAMACAVLWVWCLIVATAPPADAQEQRCTVQVFDPPLESGWAMPGDADTVEVFFTDGTGSTFVGPFVLGDIITHPGQTAASVRKCTAVGVVVPPEPTPTAVPPTPEPTATPEPTPTATPVPEDQCCTTVVTPGPVPTPTATPIIPTPPVPTSTPEPTPFTPLITEVGKPAPTPTPDVPTPLVELPRTGTDTGAWVAVALALIAAGLLIRWELRR